ncbi:MAG: hypothetical protein U5R31_16970 [Acidimicrobiia bacterium]|nr:hypothetical protein [Acidimicrobiia bacterium]
MVRDNRGPVRFELTTELGAYWELLATHAPDRVLELVGQFAREEDIDPTAVFGGHDPFDDGSTKDERLVGFRAAMLGEGPDGTTAGFPGLYNDGTRAITCLAQRSNTLDALLGLVIAAATPHQVIDAHTGAARFPSGSEAIAQLTDGSAQDCRFSDPVIVERLVQLATEGRYIRLDDPIGIYILDVQTHVLEGPMGDPIPKDSCRLSRPGPDAKDGRSRYQRLELEIPDDAGFTLADVCSRRTNEPIVHGAQIAELVQLGIYLRVSAAGALGADLPSPEPTPWVPCHQRAACEDLIQAVGAEPEGDT